MPPLICGKDTTRRSTHLTHSEPRLLIKYQAYVLLGPPGSGKGTQGQLLSRVPSLVHVSIHDVFGSFDLESEMWSMYREYSDRGRRMLNLVVVEMLRYHLRILTEQGRLRPEIDTVLLDGIPANAAQAEAIRSFVDVRLVFNLWLPNHAEILRRMQKTAIADEHFEETSNSAIQDRLRLYIDEAVALIDCYQPLTRVVMSIGEPVAVFREILRMIKALDGDRLAKAQNPREVADPSVTPDLERRLRYGLSAVDSVGYASS
jgi:adenylate kinase